MSFRTFVKRIRREIESTGSRRGSARLRVNQLERRELLTGNWTALAHAVPGGGGSGTMIQLSDGSVMVEGGGASASWYKLTPDSSGSYANGTWTTLASMHVGRLYCGSAVLPDGRVMVLGGEYATDKSETNTGEIYDPVANTWTTIANYPLSNFGDGNLTVLADGRVMATSGYTGTCYIYNQYSNSWTTGPTKLNGDSFSEEGLVKLGDGSILNYEIQGSHPQTGQRFVPGSTDETSTWVSAGTVPVRLDSNGGAAIVPELGPSVLLNNGEVFWIGATNHTALYNLSTNSWTAGPDIPNNIGAFDAPCALEPNGKVLFAAGPINGSFPGPTTIFEYDPSSNTISQVTASGPKS